MIPYFRLKVCYFIHSKYPLKIANVFCESPIVADRELQQGEYIINTLNYRVSNFTLTYFFIAAVMKLMHTKFK